jgi:hypothetical protein
MMPAMARPNPEAKPGTPKNSGGGLKTFFIGFFVGVFLTAATGWYFVYFRKDPRVRRAWDVQLRALRLTGEDIQKELAHTGRVVRRAVTDNTADAVITGKIKAKLLADPELPGASISVNTTDGRVTLAGRVATHGQIGKAILLAMETDGVKDVTSTLQVKP